MIGNLLYIHTLRTVPAIVKAEEKIVSEPASAKTEGKKVPAELVISKTEEKIVPKPASGNNADKTVPKPASNVDKTVLEEPAKTVPAEPAKTVPEPAKTVSEPAKTVPAEPAKTVLAEPAKTVPEPAIAKNEDETVVPVHKVGLWCHGIQKKTFRNNHGLRTREFMILHHFFLQKKYFFWYSMTP